METLKAIVISTVEIIFATPLIFGFSTFLENLLEPLFEFFMGIIYGGGEES